MTNEKVQIWNKFLNTDIFPILPVREFIWAWLLSLLYSLSYDTKFIVYLLICAHILTITAHPLTDRVYRLKTHTHETSKWCNFTILQVTELILLPLYFSWNSLSSDTKFVGAYIKSPKSAGLPTASNRNSNINCRVPGTSI